MKRLVPGLNKLSGGEVYCHPVSVVDMELGKGGIGGEAYYRTLIKSLSRINILCKKQGIQ